MRELPPVVLLHGWGGSYSGTWQDSDLVRSLHRAGRKVIGIDLPGHGRGPVSHEPGDYEFIADLVAAALPRDVVLDAAGFSLGGKMLLQLAAEQPRRFRRLAIGGVGENLFRPEAGDAVSAALLDGLPSDASAALRSVVEEARSSGNDPLALSAVIRRPPRPIDPDVLRAIHADVLLVVGTDDVIAGSLTPLADAMPTAGAVVVPGLDHMSTPRSPEFQGRAAAFLLRTGERAGAGGHRAQLAAGQGERGTDVTVDRSRDFAIVGCSPVGMTCAALPVRESPRDCYPGETTP